MSFASVSPHPTRVVLKLGTNVLRTEDGSLDEGKIRQFCAAIHQLKSEDKQILVVSSGAVALGMKRLHIAHRPRALPALQMCAAVGQSILTETWQSGFAPHGIHVAQVLLTGNDILHDSHNRIFGAFLDEVLGQDIVPIINENDSVSTDGFRLGDNDSLAALMACRVRAQQLWILSTVPGVFDHDNQLVSQIDRIDSGIEQLASGSTSDTSVGGMVTKIRAARLATAFGCSVFIGSGMQPDIVTRIESRQAEGTYFKADQPSGKTRKRLTRKRWRVHFCDPEGCLYLDDGAVQAILREQRSLLASGIVELEGRFGKQSIVSLKDQQGREIARGITSFDRDQLEKIKGKRSDAIREMFPDIRRTEIVHRDGLVLMEHARDRTD